MIRTHRFALLAGLLAAALALAGCGTGPAVTGSFDRTLDATGPIRLELTNAAGDVTIKGRADGKVHVHGDIRVSGFLFENPQNRLQDLVSNPPIEKRGDTVRIGKEISRMHNLTINYVIEVPRETEVSTSVASGTQSIRGIRGPVKASAASGSIHANNIDGSVQLSTASGAISADDDGEDVRVSNVSGSVSISNAKGDVRVSSISGETQVNKPGGRVDVNTTSGSLDVRGATSDVKAHAVSGRVAILGNPSGNSYWDLKTVSGIVDLAVPANSNFHLSAEALSGEIRTEIPIVVEEQGRHSLRARLGNGGGRVEVHSVSGMIRVRASN